jgi:acyl-CoA synthetase (AMP-forming)/AMP-acid ligase II
MSPLSFLQRPVRWLNAIGRLGAATSGGPTFAFELCLRQISDDALAGLDLSGWQVAYCGSEPIRPAALTGFADRFSRAGFETAAFLPCYGMAEATLFATGQPPRRGLTVRQLATPSVSCGRPVLDGRIAILGADSDDALPDGTAGEIAISGPHVSPGFWDATSRGIRPDPEREARTGGQRYLRTGDVGMTVDGDLHILGRSRDLIIVRGTKTHAEDVEATAITASGGLAATAAAFAVTHDKGEHLIVICEGARGTAAAEAGGAIAARIGETHGILPHRVLFVRSGAIPRSANGKIRRSACREAYLEGRMGPLAGGADA